MNKLLIATNNPHKEEKLKEIFSPYFSNIETLSSVFPNGIEYDEAGNSFLEIAERKAVFFSMQCQETVVATDGGMLIPYLDNWDPTRTRRFAGDTADDFTRIEKLLEMAKNLVGDKRKMQWNESIAIARDGKLIFSTQVEGAIGVLQDAFDKKSYKPGIWLCSVWYFPQFKSNFFQLDESAKKHAEISWQKLNTAVSEFMLQEKNSNLF